MENLDISSFNIAFFQNPTKPPSEELFSDILSLVLRHFPILGKISYPIITLRRKQAGELSINPAFIQFLNLETKDFAQDMGIIKEITQNYFATFKTKEVNQFAIRLASIGKANYLGDVRQLMKGKSSKISATSTDVLSPDRDVKLGIRLIFRRGEKRCELRIEPYFNKLNFNYVDFNTFQPKLEVLPADVFKLVDDEVHFFTNDIARVLP